MLRGVLVLFYAVFWYCATRCFGTVLRGVLVLFYAVFWYCATRCFSTVLRDVLRYSAMFCENIGLSLPRNVPF